MSLMASVSRITAAVLRAFADELDRGGKTGRQRRDLTGTTDAALQVSPRVAARRPGRRYQPERRRQVGFGIQEQQRGEDDRG